MQALFKFKVIMLFALLLYLTTACTGSRPTRIPGYPNPYKVFNKWYQPIPSAMGFSQTGQASWYGKKFHGKKTANGEIYNMHALTAAHKTLPLGTWLHVENLENGKEIKVRVNDRGPFVGKRIIDLSYKAAVGIDMTGNGTARVRINAINKPVVKKKDLADTKPIVAGEYSTQVGSFSEKTNAEGFSSELSKIYKDVYLTFENGVYKVRVGRYSLRKDAEKTKEKLKMAGYTAFIVQDK